MQQSPKMATAAFSGPTTRSKYAQALADIVCRGGTKQIQPPLTMTELAQAVIDDDSKAALEFANEMFDEDSGQLLKY